LILWLWYWFRYGLCGTRCDIDAAVLVDWLLTATLLEAGFLPGIAAKTTLRPRLDAHIFLAYTDRLWQFNWRWCWCGRGGYDVNSAVVVGWLFTTALLETRFLRVIAAVAARRPGQDAKDFFADTSFILECWYWRRYWRRYRLWNGLRLWGASFDGVNWNTAVLVCRLLAAALFETRLLRIVLAVATFRE